MLAKRIEHKVYICGIEVPAVDITASTSSGGLAGCNITVAAHPMILGLGEADKAQVAVFYLDSWFHLKAPTWCLMFEGYIAGCSYASTPSSRQMTITCVSNMQSLSKLYLELLGGKGGGKRGVPDKITPNEITLRGEYPRRLFTKNLDNKNYITRPSEILYNIMLATTGINEEVTKTPSKSPSKDVDIELERIALVSKLNRDQYLSTLPEVNRQAWLNAKNSELRKILETDTLLRVSTTDVIDAKTIDELDKEYIKVTYDKLLKNRVTNSKATANSGFFTRFFNLTKLEKHIVGSPILEGIPGTDNSKAKEPSGVFPMLKTSRGMKYSRILATQSGFKYGEGGSALSLVRNLFSVFNYTVTDTLCPPAYKTDELGTPEAQFEMGGKSNRIAQHITKPNSMYSLPPACNAIFPCMLRSWQMNLDYENLPTRLYYDRKSQGRSLNIKSAKRGFSDHGTNIGYPATFTRHAQDAAASKRSDLEVLVFPEEYYKGPNPIFTEIDPLFFEIKKQENAGRLKKSDLTKPALIQDTDKSIPADQLNLVGQALISSADKGNSDYALYVKKAQIDYTEARTKSRAATVVTTFNPYIVCDFPCIVFDSEDTGCHLVGYVTSVNHQMSQGQAVTQIGLAAVRTLKDMIIGAFNQGMEYPVHPMDPITEVREVLQRLEPANLYYANLFYRDSIDQIGKTDYSKRFYEWQEAKSEVESFSQLKEDTSDESATSQQELNNSTKKLEEKRLRLADSDPDLSNSVLNYLKLVGIRKNPNSVEPPQSLEGVLGISKVLSSERARQTYVDTLRGVLVPLEEVKEFFSDIELAYQYIKRPVCTLEQYIDFYQSSPPSLPVSMQAGATVLGGRGRGVRGGKVFLDDIPGYAPYYTLIREFVGGPGFEPGSKAAALTDFPKAGEQTATAIQSAGQLRFLSADSSGNIVEKIFADIQTGRTVALSELPDTIQDWQDLLVRYRNILKLRGV